MKRPGKTYLLASLLLAGIASVLVLSYHGPGHAAAQEASPTAQEKQPEPTPVQAPCATTEPAPVFPAQEEAAVRDAAQKALDAYNSKQAGWIPLEILSIWGQDSWAVVECIRDLTGEPASGTESTLLLAGRSAGRWQVALPGDSNYSSWLAQIPDRFMAPATKEELGHQNLAAAGEVCPSIDIYRLPYADGATVWITQDSNQHDGPIDMWSANDSVVAAMGGWVDSFDDTHTECCCDIACRPCGNWLKLNHPSGEITRYLHIAPGSVTVAVGQWVEAGTVIAIQSDIGHSCGSGREETGCGTHHGTTHCGIHVHFEVRSSTGAYLKPRICDGQGGWFYPEYGDTYVAAACPGNGCFSSPKTACGSGQPDWGFSAVAPAVQSTCIGDRIVAPDPADHLEQADAPQPLATSQVELGEPSALTSIAVRRDPVEPQRTPPASEKYRIPRSVFGAGGGEKSSASFAMNSTLGQPTDLKRRESISHVLVPGYWGRWFPVVKRDVYLPVVVRNQ